MAIRANESLKHAFAGSARYRAFLAGPGSEVHEEADAFPSGFPYTERHIKCAWHDSALRPSGLKTHLGEDVEVEHPGRWNLEAGPDFLDAVLRIGPERRRVAGDVEIHIRPADWRQHGHSGDLRYRRVVAHVTFFPGALPANVLPPGAVQVELKSALSANPRFSFEAIDLAAYPYCIPVAQTPCSRLLHAWPPESVQELLESAGQERLRLKAERLRLAVSVRGPDQALYEEVLCALGFKQNRLPFRRLASFVPVEVLREESGLDHDEAYALLAGVAGLLPAKIPERWDEETRAWVRRLWSLWWKRQSKWAPLVMAASEWRLSNLRPVNHPLRRMMAAVWLFCSAAPMLKAIDCAVVDSDENWERLLRMLEVNPKPPAYWNLHLALGGRRQPCSALVGERRAAAILSNVILPFLAATGRLDVVRANLLRHIPAEEDNSLVRETALHLLGPDHNPSVYRTGLRQQGLLQIFHDFCLNNRAGCGACPMLKALEESKADSER